MEGGIRCQSDVKTSPIVSFEDRGRGPMSQSAGSLQNLERARKQFSPKSSTTEGGPDKTGRLAG